MEQGMPVSIKTQHDYLLTEVSIDLPCDLNSLDYLMKAVRGTGKIVAVYSEGGLLGVNIEQKTKLRGVAADKVREIAGVADRELNGHESKATLR
jgi:hypothetical protein